MPSCVIKYRPLEQSATNLVTCIIESYPLSKKWGLLLGSTCNILLALCMCVCVRVVFNETFKCSEINFTVALSIFVPYLYQRIATLMFLSGSQCRSLGNGMKGVALTHWSSSKLTRCRVTDRFTSVVTNQHGVIPPETVICFRNGMKT